MKDTPEAIGGGLAKSMSRKFKSEVNIGVHVDSRPGVNRPDNSWRKEEQQRLEAELKALKKELANFNPEEAAKRIKSAIENKIKIKELRLQEHKLKLDVGYPDY